MDKQGQNQFTTQEAAPFETASCACNYFVPGFAGRYDYISVLPVVVATAVV